MTVAGGRSTTRRRSSGGGSGGSDSRGSNLAAEMLMRQLLDDVAQLREDMSDVARKADLAALVPREVWDTQHRQLVDDVQMYDRRLTKLEADFNDFRVGSVRGIDGMADRVRREQSTRFDQFLMVGVGALLSAVLYLLVYALQHPH